MIGGRGENICTSRVEGGGGAGATREALSSGGRAGAGGDNPGGGETVWLEGEKKVRLGLVEMGVPSSSKVWVGGGRGAGGVRGRALVERAGPAGGTVAPEE